MERIGTFKIQNFKTCSNSRVPNFAPNIKEAEAQKEIQHTNKAEEVVLLKKQDREEEIIFVNPKMKNKKTKGAKAAKSGERGKPIKHTADTLQLFHSLKLVAPSTTDDVPPLMEKLGALLVHYNNNVEESEDHKDAAKAYILGGEAEDARGVSSSPQTDEFYNVWGEDDTDDSYLARIAEYGRALRRMWRCYHGRELSEAEIDNRIANIEFDMLDTEDMPPTEVNKLLAEICELHKVREHIKLCKRLPLQRLRGLNLQRMLQQR